MSESDVPQPREPGSAAGAGTGAGAGGEVRSPRERGTGAGEGGDAQPGEQTIRRKRPATVVFAETMLMLEAFVVFFATLVAFGLRVAPPAQVWTVGAVLAVLFLVLSGLQRRRWGRIAGSVAQLPLLAGGFVIPMMWAVGGVFVVLWVALLRLGGRIDRERAAFDAANPDAVEPPRPRRGH